MMDSLYTGISGLTSAQQALNAGTNNISNINTVAYKADVVSFADLMYQNGSGKGTSIVNIEKDFVQGELKITANEYDMAIKGDGFFNVYDVMDNEVYYTRAGNFRMGVDGTLQMPSGQQVMGLSIDAPSVVSTNDSITEFGDSHDIFLASQSIHTSDTLISINAASTDYMTTVTSTGVSGTNYKTEGSLIRDIDALTSVYRNALNVYSSNTTEGTDSTSQSSIVNFGTNELVSGDLVSIFVDGAKYEVSFDTDTTTTMNNLSDQISNITGFTSSYDATTGELSIQSLIPGKTISITGASINDSSISIDTTQAVEGEGLASVLSARDALKTAIESAGAEFLELTNTVNLDNQDTLTLTQLQLQLDQLNISSEDPFGTLSVDDGALFITQDGHRFLVGKVATTVFRDDKSLDPRGENVFAKTTQSGDPIYAGDINTIDNKLLELSNTDFSEELVQMMTIQRSFEGSSKSIMTSDELLKTAIQLKK